MPNPLPMKTQLCILILAAVMFTGVAMPLHAQLVGDGATTTLNNVTNIAWADREKVSIREPFRLVSGANPAYHCRQVEHNDRPGMSPRVYPPPFGGEFSPTGLAIPGLGV